MLMLNVFLNILHSYCENIPFLCVIVSEPEVPKEKFQFAPVKIGIGV